MIPSCWHILTILQYQLSSVVRLPPAPTTPLCRSLILQWSSSLDNYGIQWHSFRLFIHTYTWHVLHPRIQFVTVSSLLLRVWCSVILVANERAVRDAGRCGVAGRELSHNISSAKKRFKQNLSFRNRPAYPKWKYEYDSDWIKMWKYHHGVSQNGQCSGVCCIQVRVLGWVKCMNRGSWLRKKETIQSVSLSFISALAPKISLGK